MNEISFIINDVELYTEKVLVEFEIPLLFICKDKSNKRYTVLCVNSDEERYLVVQSRVADIVDMIQNTITMKELFLKSNNGTAWMITAGESFEDGKVSIIDMTKVAEEDLPADGAFYEVYNADIHDYVDILLDKVPRVKAEKQIISFKTSCLNDYLKKTNEWIAFQEYQKMEEMNYGENHSKIIYCSNYQV